WSSDVCSSDLAANVRPSRMFPLVWVASAMVLLVAACLLSLVVGRYPAPLGHVLSALVSPGSGEAETIVRHVRIPRTVSGVLAGSALGVAGAVMQGLTRNPLAEPGILGVNAGASLAVVTAIAFGVPAVSGHLWFAFAGAGTAALVVYVLGSDRKS